MVPADMHDFFVALSGASAALLGLLFVAISVAANPVVGADAPIVEQVRASSALTAFVTPLILALAALIPDNNVGWVASVIGTLGVLFVAATLRRVGSLDPTRRPPWRAFTILGGFLVVMAFQLASGIELIVHSDQTRWIYSIAGVSIASVSIGVDRAWELVGARHSSGLTSLTDIIQGERSEGADDAASGTRSGDPD